MKIKFNINISCVFRLVVNKVTIMTDLSESTSYDPGSLPTLLPVYYKYIFPYSLYCKWLQYGQGNVDNSSFWHREFSFTLQNDIYVRYQSFKNQSEFEKELQRMNPHKIDIGAIYNHPPKDHTKFHSGTFKAQTKELVFDIDMTDYDDVRKCCQGADICHKCWTLMKIAIKVIHLALTEDFGFKHIFWVYSGRRGVHCWVCDKKAQSLSAAGRSAIVEYLSLIQGGSADKRVFLRQPIHPYIQRCLKVVSNYWKTYALENQDLLGNDEKVKEVLKLIPYSNVCKDIEEAFGEPDCQSSDARWSKLRSICTNAYNLESKQNSKIKYTALEIMLQYCFPRLDVNVSKGVNHLLKSPFCIHPKTGRVCVPIDYATVDQFNPFSVPTISKLCLEVENVGRENVPPDDAENKGKRGSSLYKKTCLQPYMKSFEQFLSKLLREDCKLHAIEKSDEKGDF